MDARITRMEEKRLAGLGIPPDTVINELIFGYLFGIVERETEKQQGNVRYAMYSRHIEINQHRRFAKAAHDALYGALPQVVNALKKS